MILHPLTVFPSLEFAHSSVMFLPDSNVSRFARRGLPVITAVEALLDDITDHTSYFSDDKQ